MIHQWQFEIPKDAQTEALPAAIPSNWSWVDGRLYAPLEMYDDNLVAPTTKFHIDRFDIVPTIRGTGPNHDEAADHLAILLDRKYPAELSFNYAGYQRAPFPLSTVQALISGYLRLGYGRRGYLLY